MVWKALRNMTVRTLCANNRCILSKLQINIYHQGIYNEKEELE